MGKIKCIVRRNISLFMENKKNLVLCFFSIIIVIGLYVVFLRDFILQSVMESGLPSEIVYEFTDRLMIAGLLIVLNTTTCFGIMQIAVNDIEIGIRKDFLVAPITKCQLVLGYWITSVLVSGFFTCLTVLGAECYLHKRYSNVLGGWQLLEVFFMVYLCAIVNSGILLCFIRFIKDTTTFSTFGNLYGMLVGFLAGTYLPYELYPTALKNILFYYPPTHLTSIMRQFYLRDWKMSTSQQYGIEICNKLYQVYGVKLTQNGVLYSLSQQFAVITLSILILIGAVFLITTLDD